MPEDYLIGVDLGTSATKAALYDTSGRLIAQAMQGVDLLTPAPGQAEQDSADFYRSAAQTVRACLDQSGLDPARVKAIAFDSQMAGIGAVDEDFAPVGPFDSWLDMRCQPFIEWMERDAGERIIDLSGCPATCDHGPKMLWRKHERPAEYARSARFVTPAGYVAGRLAGLRAEQAFMDYTFIHFSGFSDSRACAWSQELCDRFGLDIGKLPRIVQPWDVVGEVVETAARDFGLAPGTPVAAGCGDTAACALGAGVVRPGMLYDTAGTAAVLAATTEHFVADRAHRTLLNMHSVIPGLYHPLAYIAGGGLAVRWFRDAVYNRRRGEPLPPDLDAYDEIDRLAGAVPPGAEGLFFSPHMGGRVCPATPAMRGAWVGLSWNHTQAHFYRAVLESVAFEYAGYLDILRAQLGELSLIETRVAGGGARSAVWNQIKADVLGLPYRQLAREESGTWGAALIAGKAAGVFSDLAETAAESAGVAGEPFEPDPDRHSLYAPLVERFASLQSNLAEWYKGESH